LLPCGIFGLIDGGRIEAGGIVDQQIHATEVAQGVLGQLPNLVGLIQIRLKNGCTIRARAIQAVRQSASLLGAVCGNE